MKTAKTYSIEEGIYQTFDKLITKLNINRSSFFEEKILEFIKENSSKVELKENKILTIKNLSNHFYTIKSTVTEKVEVLYVEMDKNFSRSKETPTGNLTSEEKQLIVSLLKDINTIGSKSKKEVENILEKISDKTTLIPADVFTRTGLIGTISTKIDPSKSVSEIIKEMLDEAFVSKVKELGERNQKKMGICDAINYKDIDGGNIISSLTGGVDFCIGNSKTLNKVDWLDRYLLINENLENDIIIFGKKTEVDKPGVVAIIQVDENDNIIYNVENNELNLKANMFDIGFFPEKCYFTAKLIN